jgi:flagellar biosynthesis protein FliR
MEYYILQFILYLLIFVRVISLFITAPIFSHSVIPVQIKICIAAFFALAIFPLLKGQLPKMNLDLLSFSIAGLLEVMVGLTIGFASSILFYGFQMAGEFIGFDIGLNVATIFDPEIGTSGVTSEFFYYMSLLFFLILNGHYFIVESVKISYESIPINSFMISETFYKKFFEICVSIFIVAIKISAPVMVTLFLTNIALGILSRVVPQMNIFMVGFPLKIAAGMIIISIIIPFIMVVFKKLLIMFEFNIVELIRYM